MDLCADYPEPIYKLSHVVNITSKVLGPSLGPSLASSHIGIPLVCYRSSSTSDTCSMFAGRAGGAPFDFFAEMAAFEAELPEEDRPSSNSSKVFFVVAMGATMARLNAKRAKLILGWIMHHSKPKHRR